MPNDAYQRRLAEWEAKERERKAAMKPPPPYEPSTLRVRVPWGCLLWAATGVALFVYAIYRYFKLHGG